MAQSKDPKGLLAFLYRLRFDPDDAFAKRFKQSAADAEACMKEYGLPPEVKAAVYKAGLKPGTQPDPTNMRDQPDLASLRELTDFVADEFANWDTFRTAW